MGNCTTKPKVLMDSDDAPPPPERQKKEVPAEETEDDAAAARRSEKGKEIMVEGDAEDDGQQAPRRPSLSHLFNEDKQRNEIQIETTEPEPMKQEIKNQTGPSSEVPKLGFAFPEIPKIEVPQPREQEIKNETDSSSPSEVPKLETFVPEVSEVKAPQLVKQEDPSLEVLEVKVPQPMQQEMMKDQTDPSTEVAKMEAPVPKTSEVVKIPEVFVGAKEVSETVPDQQTPREPVFVDAQERIEPESVGINGAMATDKKEIVSAEANNAEYTVFVGTENKEKDVSLEKKAEETRTFSELGTEEEKKGAEKPEIAK